MLNSIAKQTYKEGTTLPDKTQGYDHFTDSLGYLISFLYPIKTFYEPAPQERFAVKTGAMR